jgi:GNAT superfamily N-acetyltransferase
MSANKNENLEDLDEEYLLSAAQQCREHLIICQLRTTFKTCHRKELLIECKGSNFLTDIEQNSIFMILEENMKTWYEKTWGWKETEKKKEIFQSDSRFLCLYEVPESMNAPNNTVSLGEDVANKRLVAFAMFRFEWDDEDEPEHPVLFCYEVQIRQDHQGLKIGRFLMDQLLKISNHWKMWKVLLTCFKINKPAMDFYFKIGFGIDANSPSSCGYDEEVYEILSNRPRKK